MLIAAEKISKRYTEKVLLQDCSFYLDEGQKIGVIGINGTGKSTLLKIMAQAEKPDSGTISTKAGARIGYLSQNPQLDPAAAVLEQVLGSAANEQRELQEYEAKTILNKLGITSFEDKVGVLSGGQKKRVALAQVLATPCDALILDEPTNHLDNDMIAWLESTLVRFNGAVLMVTHDRYFLDRVVTRIAEVSQGQVYMYDANYSKYVELKAQREEMLLGTERKRKSFLRKELEWISRGPQGRGTKSRVRIERFEELNKQSGPAAASKLDLSSVSSRLGKKIIEVEGISKSFGDKVIVRDFTQLLSRDARIGIVGNNGCGKSTLLKLVSGQLAPDTGEVVLGETVKIGFFSQENSEMDESLRVIDYIKNIAEVIETPEGTLTASQMLEKFLFPPDLQWNTIGRLSGGEKRRLLLLTVVMTAPNVLLLDEPTNDLDIETLVILEDYLENFNGAVLVVSHDRYFLDKVADWILEFQPDGTLKKYLGGYSDYLKARGAQPLQQKGERNKKETAPKKEGGAPAPKTKFTYKEQREYETIDAEIAQLEKEQEELEQELIEQASNFELLQDLLDKKARLEKELEEKTERWFYLQEVAEQIQQGQAKA